MTRLIWVALAVLAMPDFCQGQIVWNGAGSDNNWTTPQNWIGGIAPASRANTFIRFQGTVQPTSFTDTNAPWVLNRIDFESPGNPAAHSFTLSGNQLSFRGTSPEIYSYSSAAQTINNDIDIPGGSLTIDGFTSPSLTVNGHLSGAGALTVGYASVLLTNSSTYKGVTAIGVPNLPGFLTISNGRALGSTVNGTVVTLSSQLRLTGGITVTGESLSQSSGTGFDRRRRQPDRLRSCR